MAVMDRSRNNNWWGWGWPPGAQETAEFKILEAYFIAHMGLSKRIRQIKHPQCVLSNHDGWLITFTDDTFVELFI